MFNSKLEDTHPPWRGSEGKRDFIRMIKDGHTIGDHSQDHFFHNNEGKGNFRPIDAN